MRILVTGCTGFAGGYLVEQLAAGGAGTLFGLCRHPEREPAHLASKLASLPCDLEDRAAVEAVLRDVRPDRIFHLAGYANVGRSALEPDAARAGNLTATQNLYEAVMGWGGRPRILYVSSAHIYGDAHSGEPLIDENWPLQPIGAYGQSKWAADQASEEYWLRDKLEIVRVRPFNHIGPRQSSDFAVSRFARQIAAIEAGLQKNPMTVGNIASRRDFTDVRDMVRAYVLLMDQGQPGEAYNVGTGEAHSMQTILDQLLGMARVRIEVGQDPKLMRAADATALRADASKLRRLTGWSPQIPLSQTLSDILEYWRSAVAREG